MGDRHPRSLRPSRSEPQIQSLEGVSHDHEGANDSFDSFVFHWSLYVTIYVTIPCFADLDDVGYAHGALIVSFIEVLRRPYFREI